MTNEKLKYHVLTPKTDLEESVYFGAIDVALNDTSVHNLAIAGPYGAGKSSVIHSYINKRKKDRVCAVGGEWQIKDITITLAHLCKENIDSKLIEYSILEQLFFHDTGANLPESQFSRIKPMQEGDLWGYVLYVVIFCALLFAWFFRHTLGLFIPGYLALVVFSTLIGYAVYKLLPIIRTLSIRKISLATASIEVGKGVEPSVLNKHLDEILYFFKQTETNLVVFEDLDRFDNPDLFVKLREINYLINNATSIEQNVVFVYALRDDLFLNKQRTKFFDFIVPIIPYVDGKNAVDKLYAELEDGGIDDGLCQVLSYHIGEMRMVYNIINEYQVYKAFKSEEANFDINKLLAVVAYKNCYPKDFAALLEHKGILYDVMTKKDVVIAQEKKEIQERLEKLEERARLLQAHQQSSIQALRLEYINALLNAIPQAGARLGAFEEIMRFDDWASDELFKKIVKGTNINYVFQQPCTRSLVQNAFQYNFKDIEKAVDPEHTYKEREQFILTRDKLEDILKEIEHLRDEISFIEDCKYVNYLNEGRSLKGKFKLEDYTQYAETKEIFAEQIELLEDMLSLDYINENYMEYVSLFHEGTLGKSERRFLIDVMRHNHNPYDYRLEKAGQVVEKMDARLFLDTSAWWNFDLVDAMMRGDAMQEKVENMLACLADTDENINFIDEYLHKGKEVKLFVEDFFETYPDMWRYQKEESSREVDRELWIELILRNVKLEVIPNVFDKNESFIADISNYFSLPDIPISKLYEIAKVLDIKFTSIEPNEKKEHKAFMLDNDLYAITPKMLRCLLNVSGADEESFNTANYTYLNRIDNDKMKAYIDSHLEEYVRNVLLVMPTNTQENTEEESELLADKRLTDEIKEKIITKETMKWDSERLLNNQSEEVQKMLFKHGRVQVTWENVVRLYELDKHILIEYFHDDRVIKALQKLGKPEISEGRRAKWEELQETIVQDKPFDHVVESLAGCFDREFDVSSIIHCYANHLDCLVEHGLIKRGVEEFNYIQEVAPTTAMDFFLLNYADFAPVIDKLDSEDHNIDAILRDKNHINLEQKLYVLEHVNGEEIVGKYSAMTIVDFFMQLDNKANKVGDGIKKLIKVVLNYTYIDTLTRVRLFNKYKFTDKADIDKFIATFGREYVGESGRLYRHTKANYDMFVFCKYLWRIHYLSVCKNYGNSKGYLTIKY